MARNFRRDFASTHTTASLAFGGDYRDIVVLVFLVAHDFCAVSWAFHHEQYFQQLGSVPEY
jgi:hypothetical protein